VLRCELYDVDAMVALAPVLRNGSNADDTHVQLVTAGCCVLQCVAVCCSVCCSVLWCDFDNIV